MPTLTTNFRRLRNPSHLTSPAIQRLQAHFISTSHPAHPTSLIAHTVFSGSDLSMCRIWGEIGNGVISLPGTLCKRNSSSSSWRPMPELVVNLLRGLVLLRDQRIERLKNGFRVGMQAAMMPMFCSRLQ